MPRPNDIEPDDSCPGLLIPVSRPVLIYRATRPEDTEPASRHPVTGPSAFLKDVKGQPVDTAYADQSGFYQVKLPPGRYSVFPVVAGPMLYAPGQSGEFLELVVVEPGTATKKLLNLDWSASS